MLIVSDFLKDAGKGQQALSFLWAGLAWLWAALGCGLLWVLGLPWAGAGQSSAAMGWCWAVLGCSGLGLGWTS